MGIKTKERYTRGLYCETIKLLQHYLNGKKDNFSGRYFSSVEHAGLRVPLPKEPRLITGTWNKKMAYLAGKHGTGLQMAEVFTHQFFRAMEEAYMKGVKASGAPVAPQISIGGMVCVGTDREKAYKKARQTLVLYAPYLQSVLKHQGYNIGSKEFKLLSRCTKHHQLEKAEEYISDQMIDILTLTGTPEEVAGKIKNLSGNSAIEGVMFSPPYGTCDNIEDNINYLASELIPRLQY
ncbi:MAG: LLM class flavin-dependent oxidoreductase [Bacteroidales bacterium]|nr:LLM class flavin-dependent oxidoreductase [Bacteroidales bacterium]